MGADREIKSLSSPHGIAEAGRLENTALERQGGGSAAGHTAGTGASLCTHTEFFGLLPPPSTHSSWNCNHTAGLEPKKTPCGQSRGDWQPQGIAVHGGRDSQSGWSSFAPRPEPAPRELTHFSVLLVLPELLKPSARLLRSLTRLIVFAQPPCRLCSRAEHAGRWRNSAGSVAVCSGVAVEASLLVAFSHPPSRSSPKAAAPSQGAPLWGLDPSCCLPALRGLGIPGNLCAIPLPGLA